MIELTIMPAGGRGCGKNRAKSGIYACMGVGSEGTHISNYMLDPAIPYFGGGSFQGLHEAPEHIVAGWNTSTDLVLKNWVGESGYPSVADYVEETRRYGKSTRIPSSFDFASIGGRRLWVADIHAKAAPKLRALDAMSVHAWDYVWCAHPQTLEHFPRCVYHNWPLAFKIHGVTPEDAGAKINAPWGFYRPLDMVWQPGPLKDLFLPDLPDLLEGLFATERYPHPAFFAIWPISHWEVVDHLPSKGTGEALEQSGLPTVITEE